MMKGLFRSYSDLRLLRWLIDHPGPHYALDMVKEGLGGRGSIYIALTRLEDYRLVRRENGPWEPHGEHGALQRVMYRAAVGEKPEHGR